MSQGDWLQPLTEAEHGGIHLVAPQFGDVRIMRAAARAKGMTPVIVRLDGYKTLSDGLYEINSELLIPTPRSPTLAHLNNLYEALTDREALSNPDGYFIVLHNIDGLVQHAPHDTGDLIDTLALSYAWWRAQDPLFPDATAPLHIAFVGSPHTLRWVHDRLAAGNEWIRQDRARRAARGESEVHRPGIVRIHRHGQIGPADPLARPPRFLDTTGG